MRMQIRRIAGMTGLARGVRRLRARAGRIRSDDGMTTAEYAVGTVAACAFAAVLYKVVTGDSVLTAVNDLITSALASLS